MKKALIAILLTFGAIGLQSQFTYFSKLYNNDSWSGALSILEIESGYVICGVSGEVSNDYIFKRIVLTAIDDEGNQLWWKTYGEDFHNYYVGSSRGCIKTADNGFVISGTIEDSIRHTGLLIKFDQNGDSLWSRVFGDTVSLDYSGTRLDVCTQLPDGGYLITGEQYISGDDGDIIVIKTDSTGNTIWQRTYGVLHWIEGGWSITQLPEGKFLIGIGRENIHILNSMDPGLLKIDSLGNPVWIKYYGGNFDDSGSATALSQDGNYLVGSAIGTAEPEPGGPLEKVWIFKTDTSGNVIWERKYFDKVFIGGCATIDELNDGSIVASGLGAFEDFNGYGGWIIKIKQNGDSIWMRRYIYFPEGLNYLYDLAFTSDNGIIFTGLAMGPPDFEQSIWVQKLDSIGCDSVRCDTTVGIVEEHGGMEAWGHGSLMIWPNPASDWIHILSRDNGLNWFLDREIEIVNVFGEKVIEVKIPHWSGTYDINVSKLTQGLYLLIIRDRQRVVYSGKFIIAR